MKLLFQLYLFIFNLICFFIYISAIQQLKDWMKPASVKPDLFNFGHTCRIYPEPYGVTLIMGAWNYPVQLVFLPLIGAIAAGTASN